MNKQTSSNPINAKALIMSACNLGIFVVLISVIAVQMLTSVDGHSLSDHGEHNGHQQANRPTQSKLTQAQSRQQNRCEQGWMWFNNKCWVTSQSRRDFVHAIELCKKMYNGTLPTIHSEDENEFLRQNIDLHNSPIWLYARHNHQYNKSRWLDKTNVNFTRWDLGQPSDKSSLVCIKTEESWYMKKAEPVDGQTECVSFWEDGKWGTQVGCLVLLPVVCERKLTPISRMLDGPNGSLSSQYEKQEMYPVSSAKSTFISNNFTIILTLLVSCALSSIYRKQTESRINSV